MSFVRPCRNTRDFCEFYEASVTVPRTSVNSVRHSYPYPELLSYARLSQYTFVCHKVAILGSPIRIRVQLPEGPIILYVDETVVSCIIPGIYEYSMWGMCFINSGIYTVCDRHYNTSKTETWHARTYDIRSSSSLQECAGIPYSFRMKRLTQVVECYCFFSTHYSLHIYYVTRIRAIPFSVFDCFFSSRPLSCHTKPCRVPFDSSGPFRDKRVFYIIGGSFFPGVHLASYRGVGVGCEAPYVRSISQIFLEYVHSWFIRICVCIQPFKVGLCRDID